MFSKTIVASTALFAVTVSAATIQDVLSGEPTLSLFNSLLKLYPALATPYLQPNNNALQTLLIPDNDAITKFLTDNNIKSPSDVPSDMISPFLSYHILNNNISSIDFQKPGGLIVTTKLTDSRFALLKDGAGQVVYAKAAASSSKRQTPKITIESGLGKSIDIVKQDLFFDKGVVHVVDGFLTLPTNCSDTINQGGAAKLVGYLDKVNLTVTLDSIMGATCFAPNDAAIGAASAALAKLTEQEIIDALKFHTLTTAYYLPDLTDGQMLDSVLGPKITVTIKNGDVFFQGVRAVSGNDIASNGVAYVLDGIMQPDARPSKPSNTTSTSSAPPATSTTSPPSSTSSTAPTGTTSPPPPAGTGAATNLQVGASLIVSGLLAIMALF